MSQNVISSSWQNFSRSCAMQTTVKCVSEVGDTVKGKSDSIRLLVLMSILDSYGQWGYCGQCPLATPVSQTTATGVGRVRANAICSQLHIAVLCNCQCNAATVCTVQCSATLDCTRSSCPMNAPSTTVSCSLLSTLGLLTYRLLRSSPMRNIIK